MGRSFRRSCAVRVPFKGDQSIRGPQGGQRCPRPWRHVGETPALAASTSRGLLAVLGGWSLVATLPQVFGLPGAVPPCVCCRTFAASRTRRHSSRAVRGETPTPTLWELTPRVGGLPAFGGARRDADAGREHLAGLGSATLGQRCPRVRDLIRSHAELRVIRDRHCRARQCRSAASGGVA